MKNNKILLLMLLLGAGAAFALQQHLIAFALLALTVFVIATKGTFEEIPPQKEKGRGYPSPEEIRKYREEHPGTSIAQAIKRLQMG